MHFSITMKGWSHWKIYAMLSVVIILEKRSLGTQEKAWEGEAQIMTNADRKKKKQQDMYEGQVHKMD